jgi:REP element-mobilizing transposase RayT
MLPKRKSARLKDYDYTGEGAYFITICVESRKCLFGVVEVQEMVLNEKGRIAQICWIEINNHFNNIMLDEYIIMPNHVHGIIIVGNNHGCSAHEDRCAVHEGRCSAKNDHDRQTNDNRNHHINRNNHGCSLRSLKRSRNMELIPKIISQYKSSVTRLMRNDLGSNIKIWQRSFYDHIIRDEKDLNRIRKYIIENPANWEKDEYTV